MPITLGLNLSSLRAQNRLARTSSELGSTFERLSSGQRINRASDDAAGLAIADSLNADSRVFAQGVRNLNDGLSILNIADGALQELSNITFRLTELAEQAANGVLGKQQREALDEEAQALSDEYFRIVQSTEFNGREIFSADYGELRLQAGYGLDASIGQGLGGAIGDGTLGSSTLYGRGGFGGTATADLNGDGNLDIVQSDTSTETVEILLGNGDGSFNSSAIYTVGNNPFSLVVDDFNGDGLIDLVSANSADDTISILLGNGDGSFGSETTFSVGDNPADITAADFNNDGILDIVTTNNGDTTLSVLLGVGDGSFVTASAPTPIAGSSDISHGDFDGDGNEDIVVASGSGNVQVFLGNGDSTFAAGVSYGAGFEAIDIEVGDLNGDGILDLVTTDDILGNTNIIFGDGDGTFFATTSLSGGSESPDNVTLADLNGDGLLDVVSENNNFLVRINNGDGTFGEQIIYAASGLSGLISGDFNNDGVVDIAGGSSAGISVALTNTIDGISPLLDFSLTSIADAKQALSQFTQKLDQLGEQRGQIGAFQSRIEVAENVLQVSTQNFKAAESRIRDADIAQEAADLVRLQILQQSSVAVLGQANLQPQLVLQLLGGGS